MSANVWASWWVKETHECPFGSFISGYRGGWDDDSPEEASLCAWFKARNPLQVRRAIQREYPGCEVRFVILKEPKFTPGDRFPGMVQCNLASKATKP